MLKKILDLFKQFQTILFIVMLGFFVVSLLGNGCQRQDLIDLTEKLTGIKVENTYLMTENNQRMREIQKLKMDSFILAYKYDSIFNLKNTLTQKNNGYRKRLTDLERQLYLISEDSAYKWLQAVGYPFGGDLKPFGFNGPQVKAIQVDKITVMTKDSLITNLTGELIETENLLSVKDSLLLNKSSESAKYLAANRNYETISGNKDEEIKEKDRELKKANRSKVFWKFTTVVSVIGNIILVII